MHAIEFESLAGDEQALTRAVLQVMQMLGLYQVELAKILGLRGDDVAEMMSERRTLQSGTPEYQRAEQLVRLYEHLYRHFDGEDVAIYHWLRVRLRPSLVTPLLMMVDQGRLDELVTWFDSTCDRSKSDGQADEA